MRVAPPNGTVVNASVSALSSTPPPSNSSAADSAYQLVNGNLAANVDSATGFVTFSRVSDGQDLLRQHKIAWSLPAKGSAAGSVQAAISFDGLTPGELLYGLGEHLDGQVGRPSFSSSWAENNNGVVTIPFFSSSRGYGFLWAPAGYGNVTLSSVEQTWVASATLNVDLWVASCSPAAALPAPAVSPHADVLARYVDAVGHAPPMPFAATGFWQSRNRYRNQSQLLGVVDEFASRGLPLSVVVIDYLSWVTLGDWTLNPACWPDPPAMMQRLAAAGVQLVVSFYPYVNRNSSHYIQFVGGGLVAVDLDGGADGFNGCLGGQNVVDVYSAAAGNVTFEAWSAGYGAGAGRPWMWQDCSEPGRDDRLNGRWRYSAGTDAEVGAAWPREWARIVARGMAAAGASASSFVTLSRSAYPGSWAAGAALWSGDIDPTFDSLGQQVRVAQSAAMSGVALWASDTGGYKGGNVTDPVWQELVVRWTQFSAFCPIFRYHGKRVGGDPVDACGPTNGPNEPWAFGEAAYAAIVPVMRMREGLRGYVLNASTQTAATGMPMLRPLALEFPADPLAAAAFAEATFMFGDRYLVSPVTAQGARNWTVYLPLLPAATGGGGVWQYYFNASLQWPRGGFNVTVDTPLAEFPLFVRASS